MKQEDFYKDQYDKSLDRKNEINTSLSTPIGILTALTAGLYFASTNFNFNNDYRLSITFIIIATLSLLLLGRSIYHLIRAFSDLHDGFNYAYLNDTDILDSYYQNLIAFYELSSSTTGSSIGARKDFDLYILKELIKTTGINQKNNRSKIFQQFQCHQYIIYALISLSLLIIPFSIDLGLNKWKHKVSNLNIVSIPFYSCISYQPTTEYLNNLNKSQCQK